MGMGGAIWAQYNLAFDPKQFFFTQTFNILAMIVVGGLASVSGAVIGAAAVTLTTEVMRRARGRRPACPGLTQMVVALLILFVLYRRPDGLVGRSEVDDLLGAPPLVAALRAALARDDRASRDPARVDAEIDALAEGGVRRSSSGSWPSRASSAGRPARRPSCAAELERLGFAVELLEVPESIAADPLAGVPQLPYAGRPVVVGRLAGGDGPTLLCNGHVDVVPAGTPELWSEPAVRARRAATAGCYGRGAGDMKCGFAMVLLAVEALQRAEPGALAGTLAFVSAIEEECTGNGTLASLRAGVLGDAVLLPEPTDLELLLGGSGVLWCDFAVSGRAGHAHDAHAGANPILACLALAGELRELESELNAARAEGEERCVDQRRHDRGRRLALELADRRARSACASASRPTGTSRRHSARSRGAVERATSAPDVAAGRERHAQLRRLPRGRLRARSRRRARARRWRTRTRRCTATARARSRLASTTDARHYLNELALPALCYGPRVRNIHGVDEAVELASIVAGARTLTRFIPAFMTLEDEETMPTIRANGLDLAYQIDGDGPETLVLVNGLADDKESWEAQIPAFSERYRVISFDNRGIGESPTPPGPYTTGADGRGSRRASSTRSASSASTCSASRWAG